MGGRHLFPSRTLTLAAAAVAAAAAPALFPFLAYRRESILTGELWRLLTAHLVHAGRTHLLADLLPLIALGLLFEESLRGRFWSLLGTSCLTVAGGLLLLQPDLTTYCGLSGVLNGLWVGGGLVAARREESCGRVALARLYRAGVLADLGKMGLEAATGVPLFTDPAALGADPVPLAHALGALGGLFCCFGPWRFRRALRRPGTERETYGRVTGPQRPEEQWTGIHPSRHNEGPEDLPARP